MLAIPPASARSLRHASMAARASGGPSTINSSTAARWLSLASVLARRTAASTSLTGASNETSPPDVNASAAGHDAACTDPSCHQLHTSSVTNGQERREQAQHHVEGLAQRGPCRVCGVVALRAVGAALDQLDVVVAEPPEERFGALERPGVVEVVERAGRLVDDVVESRQHRPIDAAVGAAPAGGSPKPSTNLLALSNLVASLRPIFIWPSSKAVSTPGRADAAQ